MINVTALPVDGILCLLPCIDEQMFLALLCHVPFVRSLTAVAQIGQGIPYRLTCKSREPYIPGFIK